MANLEAQGVPGVFVATTEFVDGAETQAREDEIQWGDNTILRGPVRLPLAV